MSNDFSSSNPFRRKAAGGAAPVVSFGLVNRGVRHGAVGPEVVTQEGERHSDRIVFIGEEEVDVRQPVGVKKKVVKRVRVQSPPPWSPDNEKEDSKPPISSSRLYEEFGSRFPTLSDAELVANNVVSDTREEVDQGRPRSAAQIITIPPNPFTKTSETTESLSADSGVGDRARHTETKHGRPAMDVDAFKRMLLGARDEPMGPSGAERSSSQPRPLSQHGLYVLGDSSTDTSSTSRQSISEAYHDSPRSSHEISDEERVKLYHGMPERPKPPPPASRHGKVISHTSPTTTTSLAISRSPSLHQTSSSSLALPGGLSVDTQKSLPPPPPRRSSHDSPQDPIHDLPSSAKSPNTALVQSSDNILSISTATAVGSRRRGPPAPPTRRHSQLVADSKLNSNHGRLSPNLEEHLEMSTGDLSPALSRRDSLASPPLSRTNSGVSLPVLNTTGLQEFQTSGPTQPPTRRPLSLRNVSFTAPTSPALSLASPTIATASALSSVAHPTANIPQPPLSRNHSNRQSLPARPASMAGHDLSNLIRRPGATPPAPPPPRGRASSRNSIDVSEKAALLSPGSGGAGSAQTSGEYARRSVDEVRRSSGASGTTGEGSALWQASVAEEEVDAEVSGAIVRGSSDQRETPGEERRASEGRNVLDDLERLQREIDALRLSGGNS